MKKEYDLKKMKVKRRGILPGLVGDDERQGKLRITIALDQDIVAHYKHEAEKPGALPYQTQINQALRRLMQMKNASSRPDDLEALKQRLQSDRDFINAIASAIDSEKQT